MDLGRWGFILSVVALLLMYPVGLLVNMTSPLVVRGLFNMSEMKLRERIAYLDLRLGEDGGWVMTPAELANYQFLARITKCLFVWVQSILVALLGLVAEYQQSTNGLKPDTYNALSLVLWGLVLFNVVQFMINRRRWVQPYWYHSVECRVIIEKQLAKLRDTLKS